MMVVAREALEHRERLLTPTMKIKRSRIEAASRRRCEPGTSAPGAVGCDGRPEPRRRPRRRGAAGAGRALHLHAVRRAHLADPGGAKARGIRIVDVRDEATAVFAADAAARLTGRPAWPR
jgi:hypothetical protein